jgi:hypothetical protein
MTVMDPGGEVVALDAAGYGAVTLTKSVTLTSNPGFYAGIAASSGTAVTIATASVNVILRGLNINGVGANTGISMTNGSSLTIENCVISNFLGNAVNVSAAADVRIVDSLVRGNGGHAVLFTGPSTVEIVRTRVMGNGGVGIFAVPTIAGNQSVTVVDSVSSGNAFGFAASTEFATGNVTLAVTGSTAANNSGAGFQAQTLSTGTVLLTVNGSTATGNGTGFNNSGGAGVTFESTGNNSARANSSNVSGTITAVGLN